MNMDVNLNHSQLIHERKDRKMEPFFWILTFEVIAVMLAFALALVVVPIGLLWTYRTWWMYVLVAVGIASSIPVGRFSIRYLTKLVRKNRRLDTYRLYADRIEVRIYDADRRNLREEEILLGHVESVYGSMHLMNQSYHYKKTGWRERVPQFELLPMLYIVYNSGWSRRVLTIPFYGDDAVDRWLGVLQKRDIPMKLVNKLLQTQSEADQLQMLDGGGETYPLVYEGSFQTSFRRFAEEMQSRLAEQEEATTSSPVPSGEQGRMPQENSGRQQQRLPSGMEHVPGGSMARWLRYPAYGVIVLLILAIYPLVLLGEAGFSQAGIAVLSFVLLFIGAVVYFYRMPRLTLWAPLRFVLLVGLGWIIFGVSLEPRGESAYEVTTSASAAAILQPLLVWLSYGTASWLRRLWPAAYHLRRRKPMTAVAHTAGKEESV